MSWEILNLNGHRWGSEVFPTKEAAEKELRTFFKGVPVNFKKFSIEETTEAVGDREGAPTNSALA